MTIEVTIGSSGSAVVSNLVDSLSGPAVLDERIYAVNVGGPAIDVWEADTAYIDVTSTAFVHPDSVVIDTSAVIDPAPAAVYRSERVAPPSATAVTLTFPIESDHHLVRVHLAENWPPSMAVGARVHTVEAAVGTVSDIDPTVDVFARAGAGSRAYILELDVVGSGAELVVTVVHVSGDRPRLQGIEIYAAEPLTPPPAPLADILLSDTPDRSNPVPLDGATITDDAYIFAETAVAPPIDFYLDGILETSDAAAPYDFAGDTGGVPNPAVIPDGAHTIDVRSGAEVLRSADFTVGIAVDEPYPANPDVILNPGATQAQIDSALGVAGNIVRFNAGVYGDRQIAPAMNVHAFCTTPYGAHFQASAHSTKPWVTGGGSSVRLDGFKVDRYGANASQNDAAIPVPAANWEIDRCELLAARNAAIRLGSNTLVDRALIHDCGRYAWAAGNKCIVRRVEAWRLCISDGSELVPRATDSNRGLCKMAGGSDGNHIEDLFAHQIRSGKGLWWDGARSGSASGIRVEDVDHNAVSVEVSWGGAQSAPSGKTTTWPDPAFVIDGVVVENQHNVDNANTSWPAPAGVIVSMSPGVWISNFSVLNVGGAGIGVLYSSGHSVYQDGYPAQNITAAWAQANLKNHNIRFEDFILEGTTKRYQAGVVGGFDGAVGSINAPFFASGGTPSARYSLTPDRFRWEGDDTMTLSEWLALGHS